MSLKLFGKLPGILAGLLVFTSALQASENNSGPSLYKINVPETEIITQLHGDPHDADLRLFMAGNQFVVMDLLVEEFRHLNPDIKKIFYVTLPPGKLLNWILNGGVHFKGDEFLGKDGFKLAIMPDVYTTVNKGHMDQLANAGIISRYYTYAQNRLVMMTRNTDPLAGQRLTAEEYYDLMADPQVTISEPDILTQGIERHFWQMYTDTSRRVFPDDSAIQALDATMFNPANLVNDPPNSLRRIVYHDKVAAGATTLTSIHHLETPAALRSGKARMGSVWVTEVLYQINRAGATDISMIEIEDIAPDGQPLDRRSKVKYLASMTEGVMDEDNKNAAIKWLRFLRSPEAQAIFHEAGFINPPPEILDTPYIYPDSGKYTRYGNHE